MEMKQKECGIVCKENGTEQIGKIMRNSLQRKWYGTNRKNNRGRMEIIKTI